MLTAMRKGASSWPAKLLLGVIALSFVMWGMGGIFSGRNVDVVAEVGGSDIGLVDVETAYRRQVQALASSGVRVDQGSALARSVAGMAVDELVERTLDRNAALDLGITIGDESVRGAIAADPAFRDASGAFDRNRFAVLLQRNGLAEADYVALLREQLGGAQLRGSIQAAPPAPDALAGPLFRHRFERRTVEAVLVPNDALASEREPGPGELGAWFEARREQYRAPEYRGADYILVYPADIAAEMSAGEAEMLAAYEAGGARWTEPESRHVRRLAFPDEAAAAEAAARIDAGESFDAVAAALGAEVLDLGEVTRADLFGELAGPVFALEEGATGAPIESPFGGWLLATVEAIQPERRVSFEAARETLAEEVRLGKAGDAIWDLANDLDDLLAAGDRLSEAAATLGLERHRIDAVDRHGDARENGALQILPEAPEFLPELFAAEPGLATPVIETRDGGLLVIEVGSVREPRRFEFDEVEARVAGDWRRARQAEEAHDAARAAVAGLPSIRRLAGAFDGLEAAAEGPAELGRDDTLEIAGFGPEVTARVFEARPGEVLVVPAGEEDAQLAVRLVEIAQAPASGEDDGAATLGEGLAEAMAGDVNQQFRAWLRARHDIDINRALIEQYF